MLWFSGLGGSGSSAAALDALSTPLTTQAASSPAPNVAGSTATTATPGAAAPAPTGASPTTGTPVTSTSVQVFDGATVDTRYGPVRVEVQITDGQISNIAVLAHPDGDDKSVRINARALPTLKSETLTAQTATVDTVSGATYTSDAYNRSLQSAIDEARAAGATTIA